MVFLPVVNAFSFVLHAFQSSDACCSVLFFEFLAIFPKRFDMKCIVHIKNCSKTAFPGKWFKWGLQISIGLDCMSFREKDESDAEIEKNLIFGTNLVIDQGTY